MPPPDALTGTVRHTREVALREVMAMVNRLQPVEAECLTGYSAAYRHGHRQSCMQAVAEIERMIACEGPAPAAQAGYAVCALCGGSGEIRAMWDRGPDRPPGNGYIRCSVCNGLGRVEIGRSPYGYTSDGLEDE